MRFYVFWMFLLGLGQVLVVPFAQGASQNLGEVRLAVERYVKEQTSGLSGQVTVAVGSIDQVQLTACKSLQAFLPLGAKLWGNSNVGVRCSLGAEWTIYVPVTVRVQAPVVVAVRPLPSGKQLVREDLTLQMAELTQLPAGVLQDPEAAIGKTLATGIVAGHALRQDMIRAPILVRVGQSVRLVAQGRGFKVSSEGKALGNASAGQIVQVKAQNGHVVSGTVLEDGTVEVAY